MKPVPVSIASEIAAKSQATWIEQAFGDANDLAAVLGAPEQGDFLPGLGELSAWGLVGASQSPQLSGALVTGFAPTPHAVSFMLSGVYREQRLMLTSLLGLQELPAHCLGTFRIRSLVDAGRCWRLLDRGQTVLETASRPTADAVASLVRHLVKDPELSTIEANSSGHPRMEVQCLPDGVVTAFRSAPDSAATAWHRVVDWSVEV